MKSEEAAAQSELSEAQDEESAAQDDYDAAKADFDEKDAAANAAASEAEEKGAAATQAEADSQAADEAEADAKSAVDQNTQDIADTEEQQQTDEAADNEAAAVVSEKQQAVDDQQAVTDSAATQRDEAQAAIDAEVADPGTNEGHEEWTAIGLYRYIAENTDESSAEHWDAQAAVDILTGGVNTTGHEYKTYEGPVPDGAQASARANISDNVDKASRNDAISLDNFRTALDFINEYNQYRARENSEEGTTLTTDVGMNCRLMAVAAVQLDTSKDVSEGHTQAYHVGENLAWGSSDPFSGWYEKEKAKWEAGDQNFSSVGHYLNIVDQQPTGTVNPTMATGFAVHTAAPTYRIAYGQVFHTTSGYSQYNPSIVYSVAEFISRWFEPYYQMQVAAGMFGTPDGVKAQNRDNLAVAQAALDAEQAKLDQANEDLASAQTAKDGTASTLASTIQKLADLRAATAGLQQSYQSAQQTAQGKKQAWEQAKSDSEKASNNKTAADAARDEAQSLVTSKTGVLNAAQQKVSAAQTRLTNARNARETYCDFARNASLVVEGVSDQVYTGQDITFNPVVKIGTALETLIENVDYAISYAKNVNAGAAQVVFSGIGDYSGEFVKAFTIAKAASTVKLAAQSKTYTGSALAYSGTVTKTGSAGKVTYAYYSDAACTKSVAASAVKAAGTYYVKATLAADANHKAATSAAVKLTVTKAANPMVAKAAAKTVKLANVKKKAQVVAPISFTKKGQGTLTYAKASGSAKLTVNAKTGKVTVKKGTAKGTYSIKVKVKAAGNANYKAKTQTVTVKVVVK